MSDFDLSPHFLLPSARTPRVWLYSREGELIASLREFDSVVLTERYADHSEWDARFPVSEKVLAALDEAYFVTVGDRQEVYLSQRAQVGYDPEVGREFITAGGLSASSLLSLRTLDGLYTWGGLTAGAILDSVLSGLPSDRALPLSIGEGIDHGQPLSLQRSWLDLSELALQLLSLGALGFRTRFDEDGGVKLDILSGTFNERMIGERFRQGVGFAYTTDDAGWRNFAYVAGEGEGEDREVVTVDQRTSGAERRELAVDARDLQQGEMTLTEYRNLLAARGASKLAEHRRLENAEATLEELFEVSEVVWYDSKRWSGWFMVTESVMVIEEGGARHSVLLGEPPLTLRKMLRRYF